MTPTTQAPQAGLALQLRAATRILHDRVDGAFPRGLDTLDDYIRYLQAIVPLAQWLHDCWRPGWPGLAAWHDPDRPQRLHRDLARLGATPGTVAGLHAPASSSAEWLGACYVLEGSSLGARLLARDLDRLQPRHPALAGARSFIDALIAEPPRWARFKQLLDSLPDSAAAPALRGARRGFGLVEAPLKAMELPA